MSTILNVFKRRFVFISIILSLSALFAVSLTGCESKNNHEKDNISDSTDGGASTDIDVEVMFDELDNTNHTDDNNDLTNADAESSEPSTDVELESDLRSDKNQEVTDAENTPDDLDDESETDLSVHSEDLLHGKIESDQDDADKEDDDIDDVDKNDDVDNDSTNKKHSGKKYDTVVWLGDSITQGSLGNPDDNLENAPYVTLRKLSGLNVEGYGFYGYNTNDIFWVYRDETQKNQKVDNSKLYIFWVGSNDWVLDSGSNCDVAPVMERIDSFIASGNLKDYIIMGATARIGLRGEYNGKPLYDIINAELSKHYGSHFLDIQKTITMNGFGPDNTHLKQDAYDRVAGAVYDKLKEMEYVD